MKQRWPSRLGGRVLKLPRRKSADQDDGCAKWGYSEILLLRKCIDQVGIGPPGLEPGTKGL